MNRLDASSLVPGSRARLDLESVPCLTRRARFREDPAGAGWVILYPERGLFLNETATRIVELCDGTRTVAQIVAALHGDHAASPAEVQRDVAAFLLELRARGLVGFAKRGRS